MAACKACIAAGGSGPPTALYPAELGSGWYPEAAGLLCGKVAIGLQILSLELGRSLTREREKSMGTGNMSRDTIQAGSQGQTHHYC